MPATETVRVHPKGDSSTVVTINKSEFTADKYDLATSKAEYDLAATKAAEKPAKAERTATQDDGPSMDMSRDELVTLAEGLGITVPASENKHELIAEIKKANRAAARKVA